MSKFKLRLILFFASVLILFYLDRISVPGLAGLDLQPALVSIALFVLILEILIPNLQRVSTFVSTAIWLSVYLVLRIFVITLPEISVIELLVWGYLMVLSHLIAQSMGSVDDAIRIAAEGGKSRAAIDLLEAQSLIRAELTRSRHYNRPFSLIAVRSPSAPEDATLQKFAAEIKGELVQGHIKSRLARKLKDELRTMDIVLDDRENGNLLLLCPEVDAQNAEVLMEHLNNVLERDYGFKARMASASFPDASPTFDGLLELINDQIQAKPSVNALSGELAKSSSHYSE